MHSWIIDQKNKSSERVELCGADIMGAPYINTVRFYNNRLDVDRLCGTFEKLVEYYPVLSGKVVKDGKRLFIDPHGPGVNLSVEKVDESCPAFGASVFPLNTAGIYNANPPMGAEFAGASLTNIKIRRYADGVVSLGLCHSHMLGDGRAWGMLFEDLHRLYCDEPVIAPETSRQTLVQKSDISGTRQSTGHGVRLLNASDSPAKPLLIDSQLLTITLSDDQRFEIDSLLSTQKNSGVSFNGLLHAILFSAFTRSCPDSFDQVIANFSCDLRRIKELNLPSKYFGNAVVNRCISMQRQEVIGQDWFTLARRLAEIGTPDLSTAMQDVELLQREYESGRYNSFGRLTEVVPTFASNGLFINNLSNIFKLDFGGLGLWFEWDLTPSFRFPMAAVLEFKKQISIRLILPRSQVESFRTAWQHCINGLGSGSSVSVGL